MNQGYFDRANKRVVASLIRDAQELLEDTQRLTLSHDEVIATMRRISEMFAQRANAMENG